MARTTLRRRLTLLFGITIVFVVALVGWLVSRQMTKEMFLQARRAGAALAGSVAAAASNDFFNYNYVALEQKAEEAVRDPDVAYVILYDKEGGVAAFSGQGRLDRSSEVPALGAGETGREGVLITERLVTGDGQQGLDIVVPVTMPWSGQRWGTVRMGLRLDRIYRQVERTRLSIFLLGMAGALLGWVLAALFTKRITVPLNDLVKASVAVAEGDYDVDVRVTTGDEVQDLAENFRSMARRIKEGRDALEARLKEIRDLKHFSDLIILSMTNGLMTLDAGGRVLTFNRKAEELLQVPAEEVLGKSPAEIWGEDNPLASFTAESLRDGDTPSGKEVRLTVGSRELTLALTSAPILESDGKTVGHLTLLEDQTERKALEEKVRRADRLAALGTLAAGLAHEIKNPLTAVRAFVQMFPERFGREEFRDKFNRIVPRELERVNDLLEDLLDLVRKPKLSIRPLPVYEVIDHVLESLYPEIEKRSVAVDCLGREQGLQVLADDSYLIRAVHNVVLNAVQAMPAGGRLVIETTRNSAPGGSDAVSIRVSDTGPGIPPDQVNDIFNPFFTSKEKGTGLGLAVTNKIIEDQGGSVGVLSERGQGTVFTITLPLP